MNKGTMDTGAKLIGLAEAKFGDLTEAEQDLFIAAAIGEGADCSGASEEDNDPTNATNWPKARSIRTECIEWLCTNPDASALVTHRGINVKGAHIDAVLDLQFARTPFPLYFEKCAFPEGINLQSAEIQALYLQGTHTGPIKADFLKVEGNVFLRYGFEAQGEVSLLGTTIGGDLDCSGKPEFGIDGGQFINPEGYALSAGRLKVDGGVFLRDGFKAVGEVRLLGATIGGDLDCSGNPESGIEGGQFINPKGNALCGDNLTVKGNVFLRRGFKAQGEVRLLGATIGGNLDCNNGQFINKGKIALNADSLKVDGSVFLCNGFKAKGEVNLVGATIGGDIECDNSWFYNPEGYALNADGIKVEEGGVYLRNSFKAEGEVCLVGASIGRQLNCQNAKFINNEAKSLSAGGLNVKGSVFLRNGFNAEGEVRFPGAVIGGQLDCIAGHFNNPNGCALNAEALKIEGTVFLCNGFRAKGMVSLAGATIGGGLDCNAGQFANSNKTALNADRLIVEGNVSLSDSFKADGGVGLSGAKINGDFTCTSGQFVNPEGNAIAAENLKVGGDVFLSDGFKAKGSIDFIGAAIDKAFIWADVDSPKDVSLDLRSAKIGILWDDKESWPRKGKLFLDGLVYDQIDDSAPRDAKARLEWLHRQYDEDEVSDQFLPQPYEQLANVLRKSGRDADAKNVLIAKNKDRAEWGPTLSRSEKFWYHVLGPMIDYGHAPLKAIWVGPAGKKFLGSILFWLVLGCVLFGTGKLSGVITPSQGWAYDSAGERMQGQLAKDYPRFNFIVYSIDSFVPLVDLHQAKYWLPNPNCAPELSRFQIIGQCYISFLRFYLWLHIAMGWILTTLLVVGLTGLVRT